MDPLDEAEARALLEDSKLAHLGVISDGVPYVTPMSYVVVDDRIVFRTRAGRKLRSLRENPKVCIEVSRFDEDSGDWSSVIVFGEASEPADGTIGRIAIQKLFDKYSNALGDPLSTGGLQPLPGMPHVVAVKIESITGYSSGRGISARTRPGRL